MKNKKFLFICLLILAIGFAAVSTTLYISGNLVFGTNKNDFDIYFSGAIVDDEDKSNEVILSDKKHIEYETKQLKKLGDRSVLEFEVTNNSTQYDAKVSISCILSDNEYITYTTDSEEYNIPAQTRESGKVIVELIKASTSILNPTISCELVSTAKERSATAEGVITDNLYEITGTLTDEEGNVLANKNLVVYSETPHYVTTDDYGFFYVNGLEKGSHEIYYVNEAIVEGKTKEEVKELAEAETKITTSSTKIIFDNLKLNDFKINVEKEEEINITLDADTGSIDVNTLKLNKYHKGSELPTPTPKSNNYEFIGWYDGEKKITKNTIITSEMNLVAKWNKKCQYDEGFIWNYEYTGGEQTFTVPCDGEYELETWGAQGGNYNSYLGGFGAYSIGSKKLINTDKLFINVGGTTTTTSGGYNGGGIGIYGAQSGNGGGGASHIALDSGILSKLSSHKTDNRILIVAGAGGGAGYSVNGGHAGGITGSVGASLNSSTQPWLYYRGTGGTQTSAGYATTGNSSESPKKVGGAGGFGYGGANPNVLECRTSNGSLVSCGGPGGGAGYYGGGGSSRGHGGGGGGSSYIGNTLLTNKAMYCYNCTTSSVEATKTISTKCTSETPTENCSKQGNGYARITLVSID